MPRWSTAAALLLLSAAAAAAAAAAASPPAAAVPEQSPFARGDGPGCAALLTRSACLGLYGDPNGDTDPNANPNRTRALSGGARRAARESACHSGLRPCACAWCADERHPRCVDYLPCDGAADGAACAAPLQPDGLWGCDAWKADVLSRKVNLVIVATAFWWPVGLVLGRGLFHRMRLVMPPRAASAFLWTFAGLAPFGVNALLAYRDESNLEVLASAFFWWYTLFLGAPLLVLFALGAWRILQRRRVHPAYKLVTVAVAVVGARVLWLAFTSVPRATPSMAVVYRATLALVWLQLLHPLERLRGKGEAVPMAALFMIVASAFALHESQQHRGYSAERTWLGLAAWVPSLAVAWHCWTLVHTRRICGMRWRHQTPLAAFLLYFWLALTSLCLVLLFVLHRRAAELVTALYIVLLHAPVVVPIVLPLLDATVRRREEAAAAARAVDEGDDAAPRAPAPPASSPSPPLPASSPGPEPQPLEPFEHELQTDGLLDDFDDDDFDSLSLPSMDEDAPFDDDTDSEDEAAYRRGGARHESGTLRERGGLLRGRGGGGDADDDDDEYSSAV